MDHFEAEAFCLRLTELQLAPRVRFRRLFVLWVWLLLTVIISAAQSHMLTKPTAPVPEHAISAILGAFDTYEIVGLPQGHGNQDLDTFIFALIRNPAFWGKVNDIEFECGNSRYQSILDRYIAGEDIPFKEVQKVWRKMAQPACTDSAFVEQLLPLVRALNQKLPPEKHLRVLAGDPDVDWDQIKSVEDFMKMHYDRDASIASVMEKEVLSKHRKALMLFGTFHLMHGIGSAVSIFEKDYPNLTFIVSDLGIFDTDLHSLSDSKFATWPIPAVARTKGTWLGALDLTQFVTPPVGINRDCKVQHGFPDKLQKPMEDLVDAFLYLGPQDLLLKEKLPADIALDEVHRIESQRVAAMLGFPNASESPKELDREIVDSAANPFFVIPKEPPNLDLSKAIQACLDMKAHGNAPQ
jgi:hypothetical protein